MDEREEPISLEQVLKELQAKGVPLTGEEIAENEAERSVGDDRQGDPVRPTAHAARADAAAGRNRATCAVRGLTS